MARRSLDRLTAHRLMSLALTVEQHGPGQFLWIILESFDRNEVFEPLIESMNAAGTYPKALAEGTAALLRMAHDPALGPQEEFEDEFEDEYD